MRRSVVGLPGLIEEKAEDADSAEESETNIFHAWGNPSLTGLARPVIVRRPVIEANQLGPDFGELGKQRRVVYRGGTASGQHHYIDWPESMAVQPKRFTQDAFNPVSVNGARNSALGKGKPEPRLIRATRGCDDHETAAYKLATLRENSAEFARLPEARSRGKPSLRHPIFLTASGACGPSHDATPARHVHFWWPCAHGNRGSAHDAGCSADRFFS
jgi:hypothetical protein